MRQSILLPYQRRWIEDRSRFKIALKARQVGFSFCLALEGALEALSSKNNIIFLSASERQSKELLRKVYLHLRAFAHLSGGALKPDASGSGECRLPNGSRILSLPANPRTIRGFTGHVFLDEFAHHEHPEAIYRAIMPTITRGNYLLRIVSTPAGDCGPFWELWSGDNKFSKHKVDIYRAMAEGFRIDLEELRANMDTETFAQEYEGQFLSEHGAYFSLELIRSCVISGPEAAKLGVETPREGGEYYFGVDVGRRHDLTVIYILEKLGDVCYTQKIEALKGASFAIQAQLLEELINTFRPRRVCIDSTGLGMQLAEDLNRVYAAVEPIHFTAAIKETLAVTAKIAFEQRKVRIPDDRKLTADIRSIRKHITAAGNIRFDVSQESSAHADYFWALALALYAQANTPNFKPGYQSVARRKWLHHGGY